MKLKFNILVLLICFLGHSLYSQKAYKILEGPALTFEKLTSQQGLLHNTITAISQDSKGYMWFGTFNGLYKYDGYQFKIFKSIPGDTSSLIGNDIRAIKEVKNGEVWIGTKNGLCRYNREKNVFTSTLKTVDSDKQVSISEDVKCIYQDSFGVIWVGTDKGLFQLTQKGNAFEVTRHQHIDNSKSLPHSSVKAIIEDNNKDLWIGTKNGLNKAIINRDGKVSFEQFGEKSISDPHVTSLLLDSKGSLWIGTKNGLNKLISNQSGSSQAFKIYHHTPSNPNSLTYNHITTISEDHLGSLWIGTRYGGVSRFFPEKETFTNYKKNLNNEYSISSNEITSIYEGKYGVLWIGVVAGALNKVDLQKKKIAHYKHNIVNSTSLGDNKINVIYEDNTGTLWVGTIDGGLNKLTFKNDEASFIRYKNIPSETNSLSGNNIFSFCQDNYGNFWAGTENNGLNHIKVSKPSSSNQINVKRFKKETGELPSNNISVLFKDRLGDIWMSSFDGDGLMKFTPRPFGAPFPEVSQFIHNPTNENSPSSNNVAYLFEDSRNVLWAGTYGGGLMKIIRNDQNIPIKFINIKNDPKNLNSLSSNNVFSIHEDGVGNLWVGTYGGGLNKIPKEEIDKESPKVVRYGEKEGLTNDELYGILEDDYANLWISSNNGIYKFDMSNEKFTNYQTSDGLQALNFRKFAFLKGKDGLMYFGGINGFNAFHPDGLKANEFSPDIEIVDFKIFNESINVDEKVLGTRILDKAISETREIVLKNDHNAFSFEFSGIHYSSPGQNKYQYMLEGFDKGWNQTDSKRRYAAYSNLNPGNYVFKVKASNNDNVWNDTPKEIAIRVLPPFWKTWWAYILYVLLIFGLMLLFRRFVLIDQEYRNKLEIEKIEQENIKRINKMKLEFFTNISHEFKTPLTLILGPLQNITASENLNPKIRKALLLMERNANHLFRLINQVMEFRKIETKETKIEPAKGELVQFCQDVINSFTFLADSKNISLEFASDKSSCKTFFDWDKLEKILNNLISNSIRYTPENGTVSVKLTFPSKKEHKKNKTVQIQVKDTGVGIPKNQLALIFDRFYQIDSEDRSSSMGSGIGLALTKALVELHKGTISVKSKEHSGSTFTVTLPITKQLSKHDQLPPVQEKIVQEIPSSVPTLTEPESLVSTLDSPETSEESSNANMPILLIVEDNHDLQQFMYDSLAKDYQILQAFNGKEGAEIALEKVPDIVISDIMMPKMDGIQLCNDLKRNHITSHIPIILLTARTSIEHKIEGLEVGADAYISKPFHIKHLQVRLQNLLKQRQLLKEKFSLSDVQFRTQEKGINKFEREFLEKIENIVESNLQNPQFGVVMLGRELNFSRMQLYRKLKSICGLSANEFIREYRIKKAAEYMRETQMNVSEIAYDVGFNNLSYFTKCFKKVHNMSPSEFLKQNKA